MKYLINIFLFFLLISCSSLSTGRFPSSTNKYVRMDPQSVLFGIEYSFQDAEIVKEPGRMTFKTPYKLEKFNQIFEAYLKELNLTEESIVKNSINSNHKPGYIFKVPGDGNYTINMEPVTIEINTTPKKLDEIIETSAHIFKAAKSANLLPYVNLAAERSGMGHIHVGGKRLKDSPLFQNPKLLRNILVYYHKHPSLLYGFAEAFDIGDNSNIETYHSQVRQEAFQTAIKEFDLWSNENLLPNDKSGAGLRKLMEIMSKNDPSGSDFFHHYRVVNLEHLAPLTYGSLTPSPEQEGKFTVEHRSFRPQKNPKTAYANAQLLLDLYEKLSDPNYTEPFTYIDSKKFKRFWTASAIESDWLKVKTFIGHNNKYSDKMIKETINALRLDKPKTIKSISGLKIFQAFSKKEDKGRSFEFQILNNKGKPNIWVGETQLEFEEMTFEDGKKWVSYVDTNELHIDPNQIDDPKLYRFEGFISNKIKEKGCHKLFRGFLLQYVK